MRCEYPFTDQSRSANSTASFVYENKGIWAIFMSLLTIARHRGETVFSLIGRIISVCIFCLSLRSESASDCSLSFPLSKKDSRRGGSRFNHLVRRDRRRRTQSLWLSNHISRYFPFCLCREALPSISSDHR